MLIACASDAHHARSAISALLRALPPIDAFCFLGDCDEDALRLQYGLAESQPKARFHAVAGNNNPFSKLAETEILSLQKTRALITHGHLFHVKRSLRQLAEASRGCGCQLALYGHTHEANDQWLAGVQLVNPGALMDRRWALIHMEESVRVELLVL